MHTGNTITRDTSVSSNIQYACPLKHSANSVVACRFPMHPPLLEYCPDIPDREDAAGLGKTSLLLYAANPLLENGRDLSRRSLGICSVRPSLERRSVEHRRCGISCLIGRTHVSREPEKCCGPSNTTKKTAAKLSKSFTQPATAPPIAQLSS